MRNISLEHHCALQFGCNLDWELDGKRTSTEEKRHQRMWMKQSVEIVSGCCTELK